MKQIISATSKYLRISPTKLDVILSKIRGKTYKEALQILLYSFVLGENTHYKSLPVVAGLYGMREIFKRNFDYMLYQEGNQIENFNQIREPYVKGLKTIMSDIFNPDIVFTKVTDKKTCEFCDYKSICHR